MKILLLDGQVQLKLREVALPILNSTECTKYIVGKVEQKYCSGKTDANQDTCQVIN